MAESYGDILKRLHPWGYDAEAGSLISSDCAALGSALDAAEANCDQLLRELSPDQATELLPDYERVYAVPFIAPLDLDGRRQEMLAKMAASPGISIAAMQAGLKPLLGYDVEITEYVLQAGDPAEDIYQFTVTVDSTRVTTPINVSRLARRIDEIKPAHTQLKALLFDAFLCDDPQSLCDTITDVLTL